MAQATSGGIACSDWLRGVTCQSVSVTGPYYGFRQPFCLRRKTKGNFEKSQKFNEFINLSTKSCMSRTMNNLKRVLL